VAVTLDSLNAGHGCPDDLDADLARFWLTGIRQA